MLIYGSMLLFLGGLGILILYALWKIPHVGKLASIGCGCFLLFSIVTAIWPLDSFYIKEFQTNSGLIISKKFKVLAKQSSYPDMHGDYFSEAVFKVKNLDLIGLAKDIEMISNSKCVAPRMAERYLNQPIEAMQCWTVKRNASDWFSFVYFEQSGIVHYRFNHT